MTSASSAWRFLILKLYVQQNVLQFCIFFVIIHIGFEKDWLGKEAKLLFVAHQQDFWRNTSHIMFAHTFWFAYNFAMWNWTKTKETQKELIH